MSWLIYGAYGHTGQMVARRAVAAGERPVLAGRSAPKVIALAEELGLDYAVVDIADPRGLRTAMEGIDVVAHCAGPFSATSAPVVDACLETRTHYLDITGEVEVFEAIYAQHAAARDAGVVLLPGGGFDVVPTDCLAKMVADALPDATDLDIAFSGSMKVGPGTAKSALEGVGKGGRARVNGVLQQVPLAHKQMTAEFPAGPKMVTAIPWGDLASAYWSTSIPNITTYTVVPAASLVASGQKYVAPVLRNQQVQKFGKALVDRVLKQTGEPGGGRCQAVAVATNAAGERKSASLQGPNPLALTADAVVTLAARLQSRPPAPGAHTPATAYGAEFVTDLEGVRVERP